MDEEIEENFSEKLDRFIWYEGEDAGIFLCTFVISFNLKFLGVDFA